MSSVQAPAGAPPDEVDSQRRHWLQAFHPSVKQVTVPQTQEAISLESIAADSIRQHSASGHLVMRGVFLQPPYPVPEVDLSVLLDVLCQDTSNANINRMQGAGDVCFYSAQTMTANYADMCVQVVENGIYRAIAETVCFDCQTYPRPYRIAMLTQPPYGFESQQTTAALMTMEMYPGYVGIRTVELSNTEPYLFSERFMSHDRTYDLCEWLKVEQYRNL